MGQIITDLSKPKTIEMLAEKNRKGLKPWLRCNDDACYIPDRGFRRQLKLLDDTLEVIWNGPAENWEIWSFPKDGVDPYLVMKVGKPGSYEELSQKVLLRMQKNIFLMNNCTPKQVCDYLEEFEEQMKRQKEKAFRQRIKDIALDTRAYVSGVLQVQVPRATKIQKAVLYG